MTNVDIIAAEVVARGIKEEVHTFSKWKSLGFIVKKGEHALFETKLWKFKTKDSNVEDTEEEQIEHGRMYLTRAFLFGKSQVEEVKNNAEESSH